MAWNLAVAQLAFFWDEAHRGWWAPSKYPVISCFTFKVRSSLIKKQKQKHFGQIQVLLYSLVSKQAVITHFQGMWTLLYWPEEFVLFLFAHLSLITERKRMILLCSWLRMHISQSQKDKSSSRGADESHLLVKIHWLPLTHHFPGQIPAGGVQRQ